MTPLVVSGHSSQETTQKDKQPPPKKAVVISKPIPRCPKEARKYRIALTIVLRAVFTSSGKVTEIKLAKVSPEDLPADVVKAFADQTIKAARLIKFEPAIKDGHPVSMFMQLEYNFDCR